MKGDRIEKANFVYVAQKKIAMLGERFHSYRALGK